MRRSSPQATGFESLDPFLRVSKQAACLTTKEEDGDDKRPAQLNLLAKLMMLLSQIIFNLVTDAMAVAILMRFFFTGLFPGT